MLVKMLKHIHKIKGEGPFEDGEEYQVDDSLGNWMIDKNMAEMVVAGPEKAPEVENLGEEPSPSEKKTEKSAVDKLTELVGHDLVEIFGDWGTGKSRLLGDIALEAQNSGKKVLFLDNENSLPPEIVAKLENYQYVGIDLNHLNEIVANLKDNFNLICVDSIGFPVLCKFFELGLKERLTALGKMILLRARLKDYAIRHKGLSIATNQPVSEFSYASGKVPEGQPLLPFGGKGSFISKLLLRTEIVKQTEQMSKINIRAYKSRNMPFDKLIAEFTISDRGTELRWI